MNARRRIAIVTGSRAEYGHMRWLVRDLRDDPDVEVIVMAAAAHLSPWHGNTVGEIEADGVAVMRIESLVVGDSALATAKSMALALQGFADALERWRPDVMVVLGDRFEMLAAAEAAMLLRIPIAHLHGGETTEGAIDEACRHAITKMAHLHFVAAEPYRQRVVQLGEDPAKVFNFGAPGLDSLSRLTFPRRDELEAGLGVPLVSPVLLVTYHPETLSEQDQGEAVGCLVDALDRFPEATVVVTGVNADPGSSAVAARIHPWAAARARCRVVSSLGAVRYLALMRLADAVVGNSSSGIIEAPALKVATVNIGNRQGGRLRADSVIDCAADSDAIAASIALALSPDFRRRAAETSSPYGMGEASAKIAAVLKNHTLDGLLSKSFLSSERQAS
jgi:UDP-N-acetylglucosamine 2-epimerase (non-hydrolysing)/GDP/UDP-N,N'-diacetylbacillosamine 2-epimerase (hydrolysing)